MVPGIGSIYEENKTEKLKLTNTTLRDLKTGDKFSVSFNNLRKVNFEELLVMLPKNFDKDLDEKF